MRFEYLIPDVFARCRSAAAAVPPLFRRSRDIDRIDSDLREYLELAIDDKVAGGMDRKAAVREAHAEFGNPAAARDEVLEAGWDHQADCLRQDIRYGLRAFWRDRSALLPLAIVLAAGIAPAVAALAILDAIFLRPLPIPEPHQVVRVAERHAGPDGEPRIVNTRVPAAAAILEPRPGVTSAIALWRGAAVVGVPQGNVSAPVVFHTAGWRRTMGVAVAHGRGFTDDEEALGLAAGKAVVSERLWTRHLDRATPGSQALTIEGRVFTVIGVMPAGFRFPYAADVWIPSRLHAARSDVAVFARLDEGTSPNGFGSDGRIALRSLRANLMEGQQVASLVMGGGAVLLLLLAVGTVTSALHGRTVTRRREFVTRSVLGAPATRQIRQAIAQNLALAASGTVAGSLAGLALLQRAVAAIPANFSEQLGILPGAVDARTVVVAGTVGAIVAVFLAAVPVWLRVFELMESHQRAAGPVGPAFESWQTSVHCVLVAMLVCAAGLAARNLSRLETQDLGFDHRDLHVVRVSDAEPGKRTERPWRRLVANVRALPYVSAAGITDVNPVTDSNGSSLVAAETIAPDGDPSMVAHRTVSPGYLGALGVRIVEGRDFNWSDHDRAGGSAIVSAALARRLGMSANPLGSRIRVGAATLPWLTVVGVAGDVADVPSRSAETVYTPVSRLLATDAPAGIYLTIRVDGDRRRALPAIETALAGTPGVVVHGMNGMADQRHAWLERDRLVQESLSGAGAVAIVLGSASLFGMLAFWISRRARELATRIVLGATPRDLVVQLLREHAGTVVTATVGGMVGAAGVNLLLSRLLPEVHPIEPVMIAAAAVLPALCLLAAAGLAGRRCTRHDPAMLLRVD